MKRKETVIIEQVLLQGCFGSNPKLAKEYGTTEVTIDFQRNGNGKEKVDFISYNAKSNIFRCYEIKVTMEDLHSKAKKSWYGDYNYLVVSEELYGLQSLAEWRAELPFDVGLICVNTTTGDKETVLKSNKRNISDSTREMLKVSLIRTLFYQNNKKGRQ